VANTPVVQTQQQQQPVLPATATPVRAVVAQPVTVTQTPPRAGDFPMELAPVLLLGGLVALGGGAYLIVGRGRGRRLRAPPPP